MFSRVSFIDDQLIARDFRSGDVVRKAGVRGLIMSPYVGRVLYSNTDTGRVSVQWPWGVDSESSTELIKDTSGDYGPTSADQSYSTWESARWTSSPAIDKADAKWRSSLASEVSVAFEEATLPVWRAACFEWHVGNHEMKALARVSADMADEYGFDTVRRTVSNLYDLGRRIAIYWGNSQRKYVLSQREKNSGKLSCPRCAGGLKPRRYRQGKNILQCRTCGFSIYPSDLIKQKSREPQQPTE